MADLLDYRAHHADYVKHCHLHVRFLRLSDVLARHDDLIDRPLFDQATMKLTKMLSNYGPYCLLDPERVWVGIDAPLHTGYFGGFYHENQGYRYLQQIALFSVSGSLCQYPLDRTLRTLELLRSYTHDSLHHNTYRLFLPTHRPGVSFYRAQYGFNFRRWDGATYSLKDAVYSPTTRNLGNIMEGATDRVAHELVLSVAQLANYQPSPSASHPIEDYIYRDCTGQLTPLDMVQMRDTERGTRTLDVSPTFKTYVKPMRLFVQYVTMRYRSFLFELDPDQHFGLHETIVRSMLSGKVKDLSHCLDSCTKSRKSFISLFKAPHFQGFVAREHPHGERQTGVQVSHG
jgi:hypothetical protein